MYPGSITDPRLLIPLMPFMSSADKYVRLERNESWEVCYGYDENKMKPQTDADGCGINRRAAPRWQHGSFACNANQLPYCWQGPDRKCGQFSDQIEGVTVINEAPDSPCDNSDKWDEVTVCKEKAIKMHHEPDEDCWMQ